jgi:hypothetical protein
LHFIRQLVHVVCAALVYAAEHRTQVLQRCLERAQVTTLNCGL